MSLVKLTPYSSKQPFLLYLKKIVWFVCSIILFADIALTLQCSNKTEPEERKPIDTSESPVKIREKLEQGLVTSGTVKMSLGIKTIFKYPNNEKITYFKRSIKLHLTNSTPFSLQMGNDLVFLVANENCSRLGGMLVLFGQKTEEKIPIHDMSADYQRPFGVPDYDVRYSGNSIFYNMIGGSFQARLYLNSVVSR